MGPVNWIAVILGAAVAAGIAWPWYALCRRSVPPAWRLLALFIPTSLIGHNFARIGVDALEVKPWLYWMMSGALPCRSSSPRRWWPMGGMGWPGGKRWWMPGIGWLRFWGWGRCSGF
jgi:hypothetical protein